MSDRSLHRRPDSRSPTELGEWRRARLLRAGFDARIASDLAGDCAIDLHALLELVDRGCPPGLAARILAPLDSDRRPC
jgi:hypothetical protein